MSRKYMNGKWCVRCGRQGMTPFLKTSLPKIEVGFALDGYTRPELVVVDIGCGNARNLRGLEERGYKRLFGYDMCPSAPLSAPLILGKDKLPHEDGSVDIVLANYVFMFLDEAETSQALTEINRITHPGSVVVIELYPAKDSRIKNTKEMEAMQSVLHLELERGIPDGFMWDRVRWCKGKCWLRLFQLPRC